MKKILSIISLFCLTFSFVYAVEPPQDVFLYDEEQISSEFNQLDKIEKYVQESDITLDELKAEHADLVDGIELNADSSAALAVDELPLNVPAFWWGCVLCVVGVVLVYILTEEDMEQTKKALIGCLIFTGVWLLFGILQGGFIWW